MVVGASGNVIPSPPAQPPRYGLIAAAPVQVEEANWRWGDEFQFDPECPSGGTTSITGCGSFGDTINPARPPGAVDGSPFVVWAGEECSTFGYAGRNWEARARRALEATQSYRMADELWNGAVRDAASLHNIVLTDLISDVLTNGAVSAHAALGLVEYALGRCLFGRRAMVHVSPQVLVALAIEGAISLQGGLWLTPMGNIVVADAGYDGTGPGNIEPGDTQWIYGSSIISLRLGPVEVLGGPDSGDFFTVSDNTVQVFAYRPVAYVWDECCLVAAEVDLPIPLIAGAS